MTGSILKSFVEQMKWVQPDHKYSHVRPEDLQLYASKASFLQKWREWTIKTSVICSHISLIAKSIMPSRNLFLWSWKFRKKMVLELKTCTEGVPHAEARLAPTEVGTSVTRILLEGAVSRIRHVSDTDTPWIRLRYGSNRILKDRILIGLDTCIGYVWATAQNTSKPS